MILKPPGLKIETILDSGAFSAWTRGQALDIHQYIKFIKDNKRYIDWYVNLDSIPGKFGTVPSEEERERGAQQSWDNYITMTDAGLDPIIVYHKGEHIKWLHKMLDHGCKHIGMGGLVGQPTAQRKEWLDVTFDIMTDHTGKPLVDTHAFGVFSPELLFRYPWTTADSSSWSYRPGMGSIAVPRKDAKGYRYDWPLKWVEVSERSQQGKPGLLFEQLSTIEKAEVHEFLELCGSNYAKVHFEGPDSWFERIRVTVQYFQFTEASCQCERFDKSIVIRGLI